METTVDKVIRGREFNFTYDNQSYGQFLYNQAEKYADNIFQIDAETGRRETYAEIKRKCVRIAVHLNRLHLGRGDTIVTCAGNTPDAILPLIASQYLGVTCAAVDPTLTARDNAHLVGLVRPKVVFFDAPSTALIDAIVARLPSVPLLVRFDTDGTENADDRYVGFDRFLTEIAGEEAFRPTQVADLNEPAFVHFSSGTTGLPKGIEISHRAVLYANEAIVNMNFNFDRCMHLASFYWISALMTVTNVFMAGGSRVVARSCTDVGDLVRIWSEFKVTYVFAASNYAHDMEAKHFANREFADISIIFSGMKLPIGTLQKISAWLPPRSCVQVGYGMTEMASFVSLFDPRDDRDLVLSSSGDWASCGKPVPGVAIKIADLNDDDQCSGNGQICFKSLACTRGYYGSNATDRSVLYDADGWLKSGDVGHFDANGCLYVECRIKEMFKYKSRHVVPAALESILAAHPAVAECVVFGSPHETDGELPTAAVRLHDDVIAVSETDLVRYVDERVDDRQRLRGGVVFVQQLPRTTSGKIMRRGLENLLVRS